MSGQVIGPIGVLPTAGSDAAITTAWLARASGLSGTEIAAYKAMLNGLVTDGFNASTLAPLDCLYIFATNTSTTAKLNIISSSFGCTYNGTPAESSQFTADQGYTGDTSTVFLNTGFTPSTAGGNFTLNSASMGAYVLTSRLFGGVLYAGGGSDGSGDNLELVPKFTDNFGYAQINNGSVASPTMTNAHGFLIGSRTASNLSTGYKFDNNGNAGSFGTDATASTGLLTLPVYILATNSSGTAASWTSDQLAAFFIGGGLTSTQVGNVSNRINGYMTALGINVY